MVIGEQQRIFSFCWQETEVELRGKGFKVSHTFSHNNIFCVKTWVENSGCLIVKHYSWSIHHDKRGNHGNCGNCGTVYEEYTFLFPDHVVVLMATIW